MTQQNQAFEFLVAEEVAAELQVQMDQEMNQGMKDYKKLQYLKAKIDEMEAFGHRRAQLEVELRAAEQRQDFNACDEIQMHLQKLAVQVNSAINSRKSKTAYRRARSGNGVAGMITGPMGSNHLYTGRGFTERFNERSAGPMGGGGFEHSPIRPVGPMMDRDRARSPGIASNYYEKPVNEFRQPLGAGYNPVGAVGKYQGGASQYGNGIGGFDPMPMGVVQEFGVQSPIPGREREYAQNQQQYGGQYNQNQPSVPSADLGW